VSHLCRRACLASRAGPTGRAAQDRAPDAPEERRPQRHRREHQAHAQAVGREQRQAAHRAGRQRRPHRDQEDRQRAAQRGGVGQDGGEVLYWFPVGPFTLVLGTFTLVA
jgi:hypothetical protein